MYSPILNRTNIVGKYFSITTQEKCIRNHGIFVFFEIKRTNESDDKRELDGSQARRTHRCLSKKKRRKEKEKMVYRLTRSITSLHLLYVYATRRSLKIPWIVRISIVDHPVAAILLDNRGDFDFSTLVDHAHRCYQHSRILVAFWNGGKFGERGLRITARISMRISSRCNRIYAARLRYVRTQKRVMQRVSISKLCHTVIQQWGSDVRISPMRQTYPRRPRFWRLIFYEL